QKFAQLWWSPDLANWTAGGNSGYHNSLAIAAVADGDGDGFVAAGSQADCHTIWTSPDGTHWTTHDVTRPAGARTAPLRYPAAGTAITALATAGGHVTGTLQRGMDPAVLTLPAP